jgi:hypothetical protein
VPLDGVAALEAAAVAASTTRDVAVIRSEATDFPAAAAPFSTPTALFIRFIVSAIVDALTRPARNFSSTASANRLSGLAAAAAAGDCRSAYFDSRTST